MNNNQIPKNPQQPNNVKGEYFPGYILMTVFCFNCNTFTVAPPNVVIGTQNDPAELLINAEKIHTDSVLSRKIICSNHKLVVTWANAFLAKGVMEPKAVEPKLIG